MFCSSKSCTKWYWGIVNSGSLN